MPEARTTDRPYGRVTLTGRPVARGRNPQTSAAVWWLSAQGQQASTAAHRSASTVRGPVVVA